MRRFFKWGGLAALMLFFMLPCEVRAAGVLTLDTSLNMSARYDSNVTAETGGGRGDQLYVFTPSVRLGLSELLWSLSGNASYSLRRYATERTLDDEFIRLGLNGSRTMTERLSASGNFSFTQDITLLSVEEAPADQTEAAETADLESVPSRRKSYSWGGGLSYALSERDSFRLSYSHSRVSYEFGGYTDSQSNSFSLSLSHALATQKDSLSFSTSYGTNDSDVSHVRNYSASVGWSRSVSQTWSLSVNVGPRYTETRQLLTLVEVVPISEEDLLYQVVYRTAEGLSTSWGVTAGARVSHRGERSSLGFGYSRDLRYSAYGQALNSDSLSANYSYRLTERLSLSLSGGAFFSQSETGSEAEGAYETVYRFSSSLGYKFLSGHSVQVGCSYSHRLGGASDEEATNQYGVFVSVTLAFPKQYDI